MRDVGMQNSKASVIFGGTGFIGTHLVQHLLREDPDIKLILVDLNEPRNESYSRPLQQGLADGSIRFVRHDVRKPIPMSLCDEDVDVIYNLAAVHREPGHEPHEYFHTNLLGAETVCAWATARSCTRIVFTSSISPYGPSEDPKTELSIPTPETAYGSSKLAAEKIHIGWQAADSRRDLLILRPGVVFGPGEGGNVTRLLRSLVRGYFVFMGNRSTRKAAGYVKELCYVMQFGLQKIHEGRESTDDRHGFLLLNFSLWPSPTLEEFVQVIRKVANLNGPLLNVPRFVLLGISYPIATFAGLFSIKQPVSPVRVRKLFRSTNVQALGLQTLGYVYQFTLESAFRDWKQDSPKDFMKTIAQG